MNYCMHMSWKKLLGVILDCSFLIYIVKTITEIFPFLFLFLDEMGLGKTVQVVCFLNRIIKGSLTTSPALVIVPKSILLQWEKVCITFMIHCHSILNVCSEGAQIIVFNSSCCIKCAYYVSWTVCNFWMHVLCIRNLIAGHMILVLLFTKEIRTPESVFKLMKCTLPKGRLYLML